MKNLNSDLSIRHYIEVLHNVFRMNNAAKNKGMASKDYHE